MESNIAKWEAWSKKPRKRKHKYDEGRFSLSRLVIPSSKDTLDIQLLVDEARKMFERKGERFFVGKFLADLVREGVKSSTKSNPKAATYIMDRMTYSPERASMFFLRRYESLKMMEDRPPRETPSVIPSIFSYYYTKIGGNDLLSAFLIRLISDEEVTMAYKSARMILAEIETQRVLQDMVKSWEGPAYTEPQSPKERKKREKRLTRLPSIRRIVDSPDLQKTFGITKEQLALFREILRKGDNPGETKFGFYECYPP